VCSSDLGAAGGDTAALGVVLLTVLGAPGDEHGSGLRLGTARGLGRGGGGCGCVGRRCGGRCGSGLLAARLATAAGVAATATAAPGPGCGGGLLPGEVTPGLVALVDPHLHADPAEGGTGLEEAVVDVGAQRVQRHPALTVELGAAHLRAAEPAGDLHPDALGAGAQRGLDALAHGAAEGDAGGELLGDALGDQLSVDLR